MTFAAARRQLALSPRIAKRTRTRPVHCLFAAALLLSVKLQGQVRESPVTANPSRLMRGTTLEVTVSNPVLNATAKNILLDGHVLSAEMEPSDSITARTFRATIPATLDPRDKSFLPLGRYTVAVLLDGRLFSSGTTVEVIPPAQGPPVLTSISPSVYTPGRTGELLTLTGSGFLAKPQVDNTLYVRSEPIHVAWDGCANPQTWTEKDTAHGQVARDGMTITLCNLQVPREASVGVSIHQGTLASSEVSLVLSPWHTGTIIFLSFLVDLIGAALIFFLASTIRTYAIKGEHYGLFRILFLDKETNTYSLSKYQFYAWTGAALFAYTYLVISRLLVQRLQLPDVPGSLPGIIGIGAGTSIGAQIVTAVRGPKGAGPEKPSLGDFITSGGVAAPERVQMFLWTNLGVLAFCVATLRYAPWEITGLPEIGNGLLLLSGLSSAGYLGGKLARKPGPVLSEISITPAWPGSAVASGSANRVASASGGSSGTGRDLAQPIAEAQGVWRSAQEKLGLATAAGVATSPQALAGARSALKCLGDALAAAQAGGSLAALGDLAVDADTASQLAAAAFAADLEAAPLPDETPALESSRTLAELAQECAAAVQALGSGVSQATGSAQLGELVLAQAAAAAPETRSLVLRGRNLSTQATFEINNMDLPFRMLTRVDGVRGPQRITPEDDRSLDNMGRELRLSIDPADLDAADLKSYNAWFSASAKSLHLMIVNPDGQTAEISFSVPPGEAQSHGQA